MIGRPVGIQWDCQKWNQTRCAAHKESVGQVAQDASGFFARGRNDLPMLGHGESLENWIVQVYVCGGLRPST
jgi:hypothetical protein